MAFREHRPPCDLALHVDALWSSDPEDGLSVLIPDGCVEIVVAVTGRFRLADESAAPLRVVGLATRPLAVAYEGHARLVGIRLTPAGAARLLGSGAALPPGLAEAAERFAGGDPVPLLRLTRYALGRAPPLDARLEQALSVLHSTAGRVGVGAVARHVGVSTRQLHRWFDRYVGLPPKLLGRLARFRRAFELGMSGGGWADVAARCGYADQAHLSRDFVAFSGEAPERMRAALSHSFKMRGGRGGMIPAWHLPAGG